MIFGGDGGDKIAGGSGNDDVRSGRLTLTWNPGDGSDTVEGGAGTDPVLFNGANGSEKIDITANGNYARFARDIACIAMDLHGVEHIQFNALGGDDSITVNELTVADVNEVDLNLGGNDGQADTITIDGSTGAETSPSARTPMASSRCRACRAQ